MTWNIHRGYDLKGIKQEIAKVNPDILFLQVRYTLSFPDFLFSQFIFI